MTRLELDLFFFAHPDAVSGRAPFSRDGTEPYLFIEIGSGPCLAHKYGLDTPASFGGVCDLLQEGESVVDHANSVRGLPAPVLFAPATSRATVGATVAGILNLSKLVFSGRVVVLVPVSDHRFVEEILPIFSGIGLLWDIRVPPGKSLQKIGESTSDEIHSESTRWLGFHLNPETGDEDPHRKRFEEIVGSIALGH